MTISLAWVAPVVALQRLGELWLCRRNRLRLLARGGREVRPDTYKTMVALHVLFLASLGKFWNTRVVVVPGTHLVRTGPYRFLRHPNYLVTVLEILLLPLLMRAPVTLVLFSISNLAVLRQRIRIEEMALRDATDWK